MSITDSCQVLKTLALITLCGVLSLCAIEVTRTANLTLDKAPAVLKGAGDSTAAAASTLNHIQATSDAATGLLQAATTTLGKLDTASDSLNSAISLTSHRITDRCPDPKAVAAAIHPCGTLADTDRTLATLRGTSGQVEESLKVFNKHEGDLFTQESAAYGKLNTSVTDFDALVSNPDLAAIIANAKTTTGDVAAITTDGKDWLHQKLYPTKTKGFVGAFEATGDVAKHWMPSLF